MKDSSDGVVAQCTGYSFETLGSTVFERGCTQVLPDISGLGFDKSGSVNTLAPKQAGRADAALTPRFID